MSKTALDAKTWIAGNPSPYQLRDQTHFPDWHGLIVLDAFFNNLTSGIMLAAAICWAAGGPLFAGLLPFAMTVALAVLLVDLGLLIADLGAPARFFHAMRVMRFTSPLSVGVWGLSFYGVFLGCAAIIAWILFIFPELSFIASQVLTALFRLCAIMAVMGAIVVICYKGVVFSCSSQPGLCQARWLTSFLVSDSLLLGASVMLCLAILFAPIETAAIRLILPIIVLLCARSAAYGLLWQDVKNRARLVYAKENRYMTWIVYGLGGILPIILLFCGNLCMLVAVLLILCAGLFERAWLIGLPRPFK